MRGRTRLGHNRGFTLLEMVMALSIAAVVGVFAAGFLHPQIELYYEMDRKSQAKGMCTQAYMELEKILRYGYIYYYDPACPEELLYYVRENGTGEVVEHGTVYEKLPPVIRWPSLSADDLDIEEYGGMSLELDFDGTTRQEAKVAIRVVKDGETVYEQDAVIRSMYGYQVEGAGSHGE